MLQIDVEDCAGTGLLFSLKGELSGASAVELMTRWQESRRVCPDKILTIDMSSVCAMDDLGQEAIYALAHDGVRFLARGPMLGHVIDLVCKASVEASQTGCAGFRSMVFNK